MAEPHWTPKMVAVYLEEAAEIGETVSYGRVGEWIGSPGSPRAVGTACGSNPLPIVIPCHRVIGANGKLVGFGGGLEMKRALLEFEGQRTGTSQGWLALAR